MEINGSVIQAYVICKRETWLLLRSIKGNQDNQMLALGRFYNDNSYKREKKDIAIGNNKIDIINKGNEYITIIETKKSSKMLEASKLQLLHYMYIFYKKGYFVKGEIRIPKEKKIFRFNINKKEIKKLNEIYSEIEDLANDEYPPKPIWSNMCKKCSYIEFCWS